MLFYYAIVLGARAARLSGLNLGITTAIGSIVPFLIAAVDRIFFGIGIKLHQIIGMILIVSMSVLISLSDLFSEHA